MSLKKKIALSFLISTFIIASLVAFEYISFIEINKEIRFLEITDTIRSKSLQLRRHEKNFFLYRLKSEKESEEIYTYIGEINTILSDNLKTDRSARLLRMKDLITIYGQRFEKINRSLKNLIEEFNKEKIAYKQYSSFFPIIEATFYERPLQGADFLEKVFSLPPRHELIRGLRELESDMHLLRKNGEDIIDVSKELDKDARENVDKLLRRSQLAIFIFFPLFFITGIGTIFFFNRDIVSRLQVLTKVIEKTGRGTFSPVDIRPGKWSKNDEVCILIQKFNHMEEQLAQRERELDQKNKELLQSKKLAAIGALASAVAHELNNPLNNIYLSVQILERRINKDSSQSIEEIVGDIHGQTVRVKKIVGDLLEYARGREPKVKKVELNALINEAYKLIGRSFDIERIRFVLDCDVKEVFVNADPEQMERVFINLFTNAAEAMPDKGDLMVSIIPEGEYIKINVSDSGAGMPESDLEDIFEPFFTTKNKGTGLGLAIAFNIIKKHNGNIIVQSEEGKGTTFSITLPRGKG